VQASKKLELQDRLAKLERQLMDETELRLHELGLQWNACKRKAEDELKEIGAALPCFESLCVPHRECMVLPLDT
jgi:hypothetical protein